MDRRAANTLRILGIVGTVILVIGGCYLLLFIALVVVIRGGLTHNAMIFHPLAANAFFGAILATVALVTAGIVMSVKLVKGMVRFVFPSGLPGPMPSIASSSRWSRKSQSAPSRCSNSQLAPSCPTTGL